MDRLREGTEPERDLVRKELGLPMSLGSILETGNRHCLQVVLTLVETDMRTRVEVVGQLDENRGHHQVRGWGGVQAEGGRGGEVDELARTN